MGTQNHVLFVPIPAQGHVAPLMKLAQQIADYGIKVTFVNTEFIHNKIISSLPENYYDENRWQRLKLVSVPDGLGPKDNRTDFLKLTDSMLRVMPGYLKDLIEQSNRIGEGEEITCVIGDLSVGWAFKIAKEMGIMRAALLPCAPAALALALQVPKLIETGIIDTNGTALKKELIHLSKDMPSWSSYELIWSCQNDLATQKVFFDYTADTHKTMEIVNWILCNSSYEIDEPAFDLVPNVLPIGPLLAGKDTSHFAGSFWSEDSTCLSWLDKQPPGSVVYVAFGSFTIFGEQQLEELALGLENSGQPFLWVVRSDLADGNIVEYPKGFIERAAEFGKIVEWAPQEKVLGHPSIACFISHCGWNSTMEGLSMGVPFLCWPYFADQYYNAKYICDAWKIGLRLQSDKDGIIGRHEIKDKIKKLLSDDGIRETSLKLMEVARKSVSQGGSSKRNLEYFIEQIKG